MVLRLIIFCGLSVLISSCDSETSKDSDSVKKHVNRSEELYGANCAACHGLDGKLSAGGAQDLTQSTITRDEILDVIRNGRKGMPPHDHISSDKADFEDLADLIINLRQK